MSTTQAQSGSGSSTDDAYELDHIGFELEYPATNGAPPAAPADANSRGLSGEYQGTWPAESVPPEARGACGTDHCGAEIRSGVMDLHSGQPEAWYEDSIRLGEEAGYRFAATGVGRSCFGLHTHLSPLNQDRVEVIHEATRENEWPRVFFCSSVHANSLDPWRHYRSSSPRSPFRGPRSYGETNDDHHYEFRLQEPVLPEHFGLVCDFWRKVETDGPELALDWARELVHDRDERLTAIVQYRQLETENDNWPNDGCFRGGNTSRSAAEWFGDLMDE